MEGSAAFSSVRELLKDRWFVASLVGSTTCAVIILAAVIVWNYQAKIVVRPIAEVVRVDDGGSVAAKPISEIRPDNASKNAWTGWAISLFDLCQAKGFSAGFSDAFQKGAANLVISEGSGWTVANADLARSCARVTRDQTRAKGIYAIFDSKIPTIADQQVKATFVPKNEASAAKPL
jgi:hypothetical protein